MFFIAFIFSNNSFSFIFCISTEQGSLTIVRRSSQKKNTYLEEYGIALSKEAESMLDNVDLSVEKLPSVDTTEAIDKAALR